MGFEEDTVERSDIFIYYMNKLEKLLLDQSNNFTTNKVYDIVEQLIKERNKNRPIIYPKDSPFYEGDE